MAYLQDIRRKIGEKEGLFSFSELHLLNGERCVIAGHKGLYSVAEDLIVVRQRVGRIAVRGAGLRVLSADPCEIELSGKIFAAEYLAE